jgi:hypothetical protein
MPASTPAASRTAKKAVVDDSFMVSAFIVVVDVEKTTSVLA